MKIAKWHPITEEQALKLTACTTSPGQIYPFPISELPSSLQRMPGLTSSFVSGYTSAFVTPDGTTGVGEFVVTREDAGTGKGYNYVLGVSGTGVFFSGPYKHFDKHYFSAGGPIPVGSLFGHASLVPSHRDVSK